MAKAPAYQHYPLDWNRDLDEHPLEIEGAWIRICGKMWFNEPKGVLHKTPDQWARILRVSVEDALRIIGYLIEEGIASGADSDIARKYPDLIFGDENPLDAFPTEKRRGPDAKMTLICRRMFREYKDKYLKNLRQRRYEKKDKPDGESDGDLATLSSSSSSSLDLSKDKSPGGDHFSQKVGGYFDAILEACRTVSRLPPKKKPFNPFQWVQHWANKTGHPLAILESLKGIIEYWDQSGIDSPWSYANSIMKTKNGKYNEREHILESERFKEMLLDPKIQNLLEGIGK